MKRSYSIFLLCVLLAASLVLSLAGCGNGSKGCFEDLPPDAAIDSTRSTLRCRVVSVDESGTMLLAGMEAGSPDIYTLGTGELTADVRLAAGDLVEVACGSVLVTYPMRFAEIESITVLPGEFDDRCALYLKVLEDLWNTDEGLNGDGVEYVSVDLSATSLAPAERSAAAWVFAHAHDAEPLELSYDELCAQGYISGLERENPFPAWENGVLFTITETDEPVAFNLPDIPQNEKEPSMAQYNVKNTVSFDASKWRTALGAYGFSQCIAVQGNDGAWGDYSVNGGEWIS